MGTVVVARSGEAPGTRRPGLEVDEALRTPAGRATAAAASSANLLLLREGAGGAVGGVDGTGFDAAAYVPGAMRMLVVLVVWSLCLEEVPAELDTHGAYDKLTREPYDCYVRLTALSL
ncbi:hypothetical protein GGTG_03597 [Gaeumannomyces tritici R3-111a-1]|uniref:Uncharacterized protein n=1 Tax=Gaeumannomyces tritici (strain R3-111a-1) TaxID=644352 RepID=J3NQP1_GAET3|nr:hypothetical protein GGTG_03597 [Gaeumannomyces tritici R3-111a-1]EJT78497.1 hypothetical protein GGTG_03597 [Gaeumannomyces tritici R3-111a-1]